MKVKILTSKAYDREDANRGDPNVPEWCSMKRCKVNKICMESEEIWKCGYDRRFFAARLDTAMNPAKCGEYDSGIGKKEGDVNDKLKTER